MNTNTLRKTFLEYFKDKGHTIVPSSSLIPENDPTLLFTNAGMNQFKNVFIGTETRPYTQATSSQCCMRASGKHNDLENVGYTARHHTFFEMLGNFSFGDYFKRKAITYAWDFLTNILRVPKEKLWITVYKEDKEAEDIWLKEIKIDPKRFSRCGEKDNYWSMGDTGPCGPCTEIFYDHGADIPGGPPGSKDQEGDRYIEIWNLVFMQFNRSADGKLTPLPKPSVDTGMGLERIAAVMQGVHENYDIDIFVNIINAITELTNVKDKNSKTVRVIADHIRAAAFLIADGVIPSNGGRGYVLRRIIRRAIRHAYQAGEDEPFFYKLVAPLAEQMGEAYPKLIHEQKLIERVLHQEEEQFATTLAQGMRIFAQEADKLTQTTIPGDVVFKLYDTYGFPIDLTADIARERDLTIDEEGFQAEMAKQRSCSQKASKFTVDYTKKLNLEGQTEFSGYGQLKDKAKIIALVKDDEKVKELKSGDEGIIVLDRTPFYAESGGQVGDQGRIIGKKGSFTVCDSQKQGPVFMHCGTLQDGSLKIGDKVEAIVDQTRQAVACNHSATHLLHTALREILGNHVEQKGSLVTTERLRFDFSHFEAITKEQLRAIEQTVNTMIRANHPVCTEEMSVDKAKKRGAIALFGEKYEQQVRVVSMGEASQELCGGTHVVATGEIGIFKIVSEGGIAAGIRRIEAITGKAAFHNFQQLAEQHADAAILLKTTSDKMLDKLEHIVQQSKLQEKEMAKLKTKAAVSVSNDLESQAVNINGIKVLAVNLEGADNKTLLVTIDQLRNKLGSAVIVLSSVINDRIQLVAGISKNCIDKIHAGDLIASVAKQVDGKGGGRPEMAQGGGTNIKELPKALESVVKLVKKKLDRTN
ncbi:MAG: alanine--tRNA ligase [Gammaproteobacteria bacterium]|nr:alanine--tRNA ligase [Gammaproteobacteria bacterium]